MLHAHWLLALQKMRLHSSKWSAASTSLTRSLLVVDDHLKSKSQYNCEINWLKSKRNFLYPNRLNPINPLYSTKGKNPHYFPQENLSELYPTFIHHFNLQQKQSLPFKHIFLNNGTKIVQEESHGRQDHHIPYRRRWGTHGNGADKSLERWERIFNSQRNSKSPTWMHLSRLDQPIDSLTIRTTVKYGRRDHRLPTNPKHVYNLWRRRPNEPHSNNWKPWTIYSSDPTQTQSPNTTLPACATHPRHAAISHSGKLWAIRRLLSRQYPTTQPPQYYRSNRRIEQPNTAPPSTTQRMGNRLLSMRQIVRPGDRRDCCRLPRSNITTGRDSEGTTNQEKCIHRWRSERSFHFYPPGSVAGCRLWRHDLLRQLQRAELSHTRLCSALIWKLI